MLFSDISWTSLLTKVLSSVDQNSVSLAQSSSIKELSSDKNTSRLSGLRLMSNMEFGKTRFNTQAGFFPLLSNPRQTSEMERLNLGMSTGRPLTL